MSTSQRYMYILLHKADPGSRAVMSRSVTLVKGKNNMIGISIGGGAPFCPVLYVVQVRTPKLCLQLLYMLHLLCLHTFPTLFPPPPPLSPLSHSLPLFPSPPFFFPPLPPSLFSPPLHLFPSVPGVSPQFCPWRRLAVSRRWAGDCERKQPQRPLQKANGRHDPDCQGYY